ncbi:MAG: SdpI family protein [Devosia sp.]|uniref:SdpI family protein n=1 Tax=unclassified Devosia TaxID=196773 RepID=UPI001A0F4EB5|nr:MULTISPECIES: SdpI family protein [unclassified Devosia]MBF0678929.1 SdpI family protein [Devosia sp.]WEJ32070.1 SdpI family protein [Devosia sp. SD17-2]
MKKANIVSPSVLAGVALLIVITIIGYLLVPAEAQMPVHWGPDGKADAYLMRDWAPLMPIGLIAVMGVIFQIVLQRGPQGERALAGLRTAFAGFTLLMSVIQAGAIAITLGSNLEMVRVIVFGLGALFIAMGNILPKSQPNGFAGMRLPWTMKNPANWQATNRLSGMLMMVGGGGMALAAVLIADTSWLLAIVAICIFGPLLIGTYYSYRLSRQGQA